MQNMNQQSGDFKLEENVELLKNIIPKGNISSETWQKITRSHDKVKSIVDHVMNLLNFTDYEKGGNVNTDKEIIKWQALLCHYKYLKSTSNSLFGIYSDCLSDSLLNVTETLKEKQKEYFSLALNTPLENIHYENIKVVSTHIMNETQPYSFKED